MRTRIGRLGLEDLIQEPAPSQGFDNIALRIERSYAAEGRGYEVLCGSAQ